MFRLTREVRFALNLMADAQLSGRPTNSYAGFPSLTGFGQFFEMQVTLTGDLQTSSQYLRNIKEIDEIVRARGIPMVIDAIQRTSAFRLPAILLDQLRGAWPGASLHQIALKLSPFLAVACLASEHPMVRISQKFEFSAAHRLHNPELDEQRNRDTFGKCNNPHGHGHNYQVQVTLVGEPDDRGVLVDVPAFERVVAQTVIERLDHKHLNIEVPEFAEIIPSVENIAKVIHGLLKPKFERERAKLASVTVWETPKTWCEYGE